jgi:hypothetical protein
MEKLQLTGQNLGRVFNFRSGHLHAATFLVLIVKLPNLQLKTRHKQLLGSLMIVIALPGSRKLPGGCFVNFLKQANLLINKNN